MMLSTKTHRYQPVQNQVDSQDDSPSFPPSENSNHLDPLSYSHDQFVSDSEDEDYRNDKTRDPRLYRRARRRYTASSIGSIDSQHEAHAYSSTRRVRSRIRSIGSVPAWFLSPRRICVLLIIGIAIPVLFLARHSSVQEVRVEYYKLKNKPSIRIDGESPPYYPSPRGGVMKRWEMAYEKAWDIVRNMSLAEKVNVTTGTGWMMGLCVGNTGPAALVGFPSLCLQDGPLGLRFADNITASPAAITVGATWSPGLMYKRGRMMGYEARQKGVNVILGPSVGAFGRVPAGGRNWEGFGVDPVLQGYGAALTIRGIQEEGVMATIKHFVANEQEHYRQAWEWGLPDAMSSNLDDRTLHELYGWPFSDAIRAGVSSVMCSYNQVNNSYACQNSKLLNGFIKDELGFQGFIQSDWLAQRSGVASALAGLDMSMPGDGELWADGKPFWGPHLTTAVLNGSVPIERLNDMVTRIVASWYQIGQDEWELPPPEGEGGPNFSSWTDERTGVLAPGSDDNDKRVVNQFVDATAGSGISHKALARRIAAEGTVLLKNEADILPLSRNGWSQSDEAEYEIDLGVEKMRVAIYGEDAVLPPGGPNTCPDRGCNKGTLATGWGSGAVEFPYLVSPFDAISKDLKKSAVDLSLSPTNSLPEADSEATPDSQDLCIVFVNAAGGEGFIAAEGMKGDRNDLKIQKGGDRLIKEVADRCGRSESTAFARNKPKEDIQKRGYGINGRGNVIVVIHAIGPVLLEQFIEHTNVGGALLANLPGQESGHALADVIFGRVNPSGHLPYTIAKRFEDYGPSAELIYDALDGIIPQQNLTEGLLVDYRWFDAMKLTPRFEFGYGLSYTEFVINDLQVTAKYTERPDPLPEARPPEDVEPPPYDDTLPPVEESLFPNGWRRLKKFIYPYIDSVSDVTPEPDPEWRHFPTEGPGPAGGAEGGNPALFEELVQIDFDITNQGERSGHAVPQLYIIFPEDVHEDSKEAVPFPPRVLRGFDKIHLRGSVSSASPGSTIPDGAIKIHNLEDAGKRANPREKLNAAVATARKQRKVKNAVLAAAAEESGTATILPRRPEYASNHPNLVKRIDPAGLADDPEAEAAAGGAAGELAAAQAAAPLPFEETPAPDVPSPSVPLYDSEAPIPGPTEWVNFSNPDHLGHPHHYAQHPAADMPERVHNYVGQPPIQYATGERQTVTFYLTRRDLSYWSAAKQNWVLPQTGSFGIEIGFSSRNVQVRGKLW